MIPCADPKSQYISYKNEIDKSIRRVLDSNWYVLGKEVKLFEDEFANYNNASYAIGVANGTDALQIALRALDIGSGDEVITTSHTAVATASAIDLVGAKPVFVDIESNFFTLDPHKIEEVITPKTKAIIPVHIYGQPCNMDKIISIAKAKNIRVIEDCAQAHGAFYKNKRIGSIGDIGCFSFYPTKNLGAIGDGGALITNSNKLARRIKLLREYGWEKRYVSSHEGWNSRLDELQASILRVKLKYLDKDNGRRLKIAKKYLNYFKGLPIELPLTRSECSHVFHLFVIRTEERDSLKNYLVQNGVNTTIQYPVPIHKQSYYEQKNSPLLIRTEKYANLILSLPNFPELENNDQMKVISHVKKFFND